MPEEKAFRDPKPKSNPELLGVILGAAIGSGIGAATGQFFVSFAVCVGIGWLLGLLAKERAKKYE